MRTLFGETLENSLLSNSVLSVAFFPALALLFLVLALWGAGGLGDPLLNSAQLKESQSQKPPQALAEADMATFDGWAGQSVEMSSFIRNEIVTNMRRVYSDPEYEGVSFVEAFVEQGRPDPSAGDGQELLKESPATAVEQATSTASEALDAWTKEYWCARRDWDGVWLDEIVRPLIVRGVGGCTFGQRFAARSPLISATSAIGGIAAFVALCGIAILLFFLSVEQFFLRRAYRLQYHSGLFP